MKVSEVLRSAHDEIDETGLSCGIDVKLKNGGSACGSIILDGTEPDSDTWRHVARRILNARTAQVNSMCIQGALFRAAHGNYELYNDARKRVFAELLRRDESLFISHSNFLQLWHVNDSLVNTLEDAEGTMLDVLLMTSKIADEEGN